MKRELLPVVAVFCLLLGTKASFAGPNEANPVWGTVEFWESHLTVDELAAAWKNAPWRKGVTPVEAPSWAALNKIMDSQPLKQLASKWMVLNRQTDNADLAESLYQFLINTAMYEIYFKYSRTEDVSALTYYLNLMLNSFSYSDSEIYKKLSGDLESALVPIHKWNKMFPPGIDFTTVDQTLIQSNLQSVALFILKLGFSRGLLIKSGCTSNTTLENTPSENLNAFVQHILKKQVMTDEDIRRIGTLWKGTEIPAAQLGQMLLPVLKN